MQTEDLIVKKTFGRKLSALILVLALTAVMLFAVSCGGGNDTVDPGNQGGGENTTAPAETTTAPEKPIEEMTEEEIVDKKIAELPKEKYGGETFDFFSRSTNFHQVWCSIEVYAEEETSETLNDAVYRRNRKVEEMYDVLIAETGCSGKDLIGETRTLILSGDDSFEVIVPNLRVASVLAGEELLYDLNEIPHLDLTSPWWDKAVTEQLSIAGKQYYTLGDLSYNDKVATRGIYFNKQMIKDYDLENPFEIIKKNEWTLDKLYEMAKVVSADSDSNGVLNELDTFGLVFEGVSLLNMFQAMGGTVTELDEEGFPELTLMNDRNQSILAKLFTVLYDRDIGYNDKSILYKKSGQTEGNNYRIDIFKAGRALFLETCFDEFEGFRALEVDFGMIPWPKLNPEDPFKSAFYVLGPPAFAVPITNTKLEMTGTILEAIGAYSSLTLKPAYYETCIDGKYTRDSESVEMLDIIFNNRVYDTAVINNFGGIEGLFSNLSMACSTNIASAYAKKEGTMIDELDTFLELYR